MKKNRLVKWAQKGTLFAIHLYQHGLSTFFGPCCRFFPSFSAYAFLSIERFGIMKGGWLSLKRVFKCHPLHPGGYDPVPE
jgi:putative membrane protein insertion efficiency factor